MIQLLVVVVHLNFLSPNFLQEKGKKKNQQHCDAKRKENNSIQTFSRLEVYVMNSKSSGIRVEAAVLFEVITKTFSQSPRFSSTLLDVSRRNILYRHRFAPENETKIQLQRKSRKRREKREMMRLKKLKKSTENILQKKKFQKTQMKRKKDVTR